MQLFTLQLVKAWGYKTYLLVWDRWKPVIPTGLRGTTWFCVASYSQPFWKLLRHTLYQMQNIRSVYLYTGVFAVLRLLKKSWQGILLLALKICHNKNHNSFFPFPPCPRTQIWSQSFSVVPLQPVCFTCAQVPFSSFTFGLRALPSEPKDFHIVPRCWHPAAPTHVLPRVWLLNTKWNEGRRGKWDRAFLKSN